MSGGRQLPRLNLDRPGLPKLSGLDSGPSLTGINGQKPFATDCTCRRNYWNSSSGKVGTGRSTGHRGEVETGHILLYLTDFPETCHKTPFRDCFESVSSNVTP